jgi:hypothetical protein
MEEETHEMTFEAQKSTGGAGQELGYATHARLVLVSPMSSVLISDWG